MKLTSPAFRDGERIPLQYSRDDADKSPPLTIEGVPTGAQSLVLLVDDPDAPGGNYCHWIVFDIDPDVRDIGEDSVPENARQGTNDYGEVQYGGPQPPSGEHRYFFKLFALNHKLDLPRGSTRDQVVRAMQPHIIDTATVMGRFAAMVSA
jgi:Raf kinase inhibitor-like YbhB/YbcL family protein